MGAPNSLTKDMPSRTEKNGRGAGGADTQGGKKASFVNLGWVVWLLFRPPTVPRAFPKKSSLSPSSSHSGSQRQKHRNLGRVVPPLQHPKKTATLCSRESSSSPSIFFSRILWGLIGRLRCPPVLECAIVHRSSSLAMTKDFTWKGLVKLLIRTKF